MTTAPTPAPTPRHETSADRADTHPVRAHAGDTAEAVRQQVRTAGRSDWELVCVIGDDGRLLGTLTAAELLVLPADAPVGSALQPDRPRVPADIDQEKMASIALHHGVAAMPVVDAGGRLVGVVGSTVMMDIRARFETTLAAKPAITFFVPGLVYLADAIGAQSEAVAVRGLSSRHTCASACAVADASAGIGVRR